MNLIAKILLLVCFLAVPASAQEVEVGTGLICDTQQQAEQFVTGFTGNTAATLAAINQGSMACAVVAVAYVRGAQVSVVRNRQGTFSVTEILVVGVPTPAGIQPVTATKQYTLFKVAETEA